MKYIYSAWMSMQHMSANAGVHAFLTNMQLIIELTNGPAKPVRIY